MRKRTLWMIGACVVLPTFIIAVAIQQVASAWKVDFSNSAWGRITAALISGVVGVALKAALATLLAKTRSKIQQEVQERLTELKGTVDDRNSANAARRDYEYEARKHLYDEVEPLLFQVYEAIEEAHSRVRSLTRTARDKDLA